MSSRRPVRLTPGLVCLSEPTCGLCLARRRDRIPAGYLSRFEDTYGALRELFGTGKPSGGGAGKKATAPP